MNEVFAPSVALGTAFYFLRRRAGLTGRALANLAGVPLGALSQIEFSRSPRPVAVDTVEKLLEALHADQREAELVRWLVGHPHSDSSLVIRILRGEMEIEALTRPRTYRQGRYMAKGGYD